MYYILAYIAIAITQYILSYGIMFAYWQRKYPKIAEISYKADKSFSLVQAIPVSILPIFGLGLVLFVYEFGRHGLKFK